MVKRVIAGLVVLAAAALAVSWYVPLFGFSLQSYFKRPFRYAGTVEVTKVDVPSRLASIVAKETVQEGDPVKEGQVILTLTCEDVAIAATNAQADLDRVLALRKVSAATQEEEDHTRMAFDNAMLKQAWCVVKSPLKGTVLTRYHEPGEQVAVGTRLFTLADLREVWAYVYVPQPLLAQLRIGMEVQGHLPELGDKALPGRVVKINDEAEFTPKNVQTREERTRLVYGVKVLFQNPDGLLKAGMPVEVALPEPPKAE